jgi:hypothetical protein
MFDGNCLILEMLIFFKKYVSNVKIEGIYKRRKNTKFSENPKVF